MEEKKNNKGLIWLIVVLIILVLGLVGYIVYDKVLLKDKVSVNNDNTTSTTKKKEDEVKKDIVLYDKDNILITIKDVADDEYYENTGTGYYEFYFNGKRIKELGFMNYGYDIKCSKYDDDYIFIKRYNQGVYDYYMLDKNGNIVIDFSDYSYVNSSKECYELEVVDNKFIITATVDYGKYYGYDEMGVYQELCNEFNNNSIAEIKKEFEYLGNGKLGEEKIISQKTLQEYLKDKGYSNCQEIINS